MHIYLKHPIHGTKVAISDMEVEYDEKNGWSIYNPTMPAEDFEDAAPVNALGVKRKYTRKAVTEGI